jgi:hypothetical protein
MINIPLNCYVIYGYSIMVCFHGLNQLFLYGSAYYLVRVGLGWLGVFGGTGS